MGVEIGPISTYHGARLATKQPKSGFKMTLSMIARGDEAHRSHAGKAAAIDWKTVGGMRQHNKPEGVKRRLGCDAQHR